MSLEETLHKQRYHFLLSNLSLHVEMLDAIGKTFRNGSTTEEQYARDHLSIN